MCFLTLGFALAFKASFSKLFGFFEKPRLGHSYRVPAHANTYVHMHVHICLYIYISILCMHQHRQIGLAWLDFNT